MTTNFFFLYFSRGEYLVYSSYSDTLPPEVLQRQWKKQKFHYDTVPTAMLTLFAVQTTEGWPVYVWLFEILLYIAVVKDSTDHFLSFWNFFQMKWKSNCKIYNT